MQRCACCVLCGGGAVWCRDLVSGWSGVCIALPKWEGGRGKSGEIICEVRMGDNSTSRRHMARLRAESGALCWCKGGHRLSNASWYYGLCKYAVQNFEQSYNARIITNCHKF